MVFGAGWGRRRRGGFGPGGGGPWQDPSYGGYPPPGYQGYPPQYGRFGRGPFGRYPAGGGNTCLRDACLLDLGCCAGEALTDNCLLSAAVLFPAFVRAFLTGTIHRRSVLGGLLAAIRLYQHRISPRLPGRCRFTPTCSEYAATALELHGTRRGSWLTARRLLRCRPYGATGADPVPAA
jgi:putative membrane protein insertion efficiency factor